MHAFILCDVDNKTFTVGKTFSSEEYGLAVETFRKDVDVQVDTFMPNYVVNEISINGNLVWGLTYSEDVCPTITGLIGWLDGKLAFLWYNIDDGFISFDAVPDKLFLCFDVGKDMVLNCVR